jgi:streptomycin 3"-adenylyltransferase
MPHDDTNTNELRTGVLPPSTRLQLTETLALVDEVLGPEVVGVYLHGSAVLAGLQPYSDLDILVVSRRSTTREEMRRLCERLLLISSVERFRTSARAIPPEMRRPIELTIVVQAQVRPWRYPPRWDFQYGDWWRHEFERGNVEPWPPTTHPDLASLIMMVLLANRPLLGPPPAQVLDPVPRGDYLRAIVEDIETVLNDLDTDTSNMLLMLARIWSTVATDYIRSKDAAATWALANLPQEHQLVLTRARAIYLGEVDERWDDVSSRIRPCADYMIRHIKGLTGDALANDPARSLTLLRGAEGPLG